MNLYQPRLMRIQEMRDETPDIRTYKLTFHEPKVAERFDFFAGQFGEYSVFGEGESTFCIASPPTRKGYIECSVKAVGKVTWALRRLGVGDTVGFRGPYGNSFPIEQMKGHSIVFIAGGIGIAPVRSLIWNVLDIRDQFKDVTIVYGARTVADLVYKQELEEWSKRTDLKLWEAVDPGGQTPDWKGEVALVPVLLEKAAPAAADNFAVICGPPIMFKFVIRELDKLNIPHRNIYVDLERRMKCGVGKCGHCQMNEIYVCKDGPVFNYSKIKGIPEAL